jgi:hypothetical protein
VQLEVAELAIQPARDRVNVPLKQEKMLEISTSLSVGHQGFRSSRKKTECVATTISHGRWCGFSQSLAHAFDVIVMKIWFASLLWVLS